MSQSAINHPHENYPSPTRNTRPSLVSPLLGQNTDLTHLRVSWLFLVVNLIAYEMNYNPSGCGHVWGIFFSLIKSLEVEKPTLNVDLLR